MRFDRQLEDALEEGPCGVTVTEVRLQVAELLSESTEPWDRGRKFAQYRRVASLREYVLVSQDAMQVEWFTREEDGRWSYRDAVAVTG